MNDIRPRYMISRFTGTLVAALIVISVIFLYLCGGSQMTVLLVRHADRQASADALTPAGTARAQELARVLEKSGISAIYTSEAIRTQQTAAPTASLLGITPVTVVAADVAGLVNTIRTINSGQTVLMVGHSNTVPQVIADLGAPPLPSARTNTTISLC